MLEMEWLERLLFLKRINGGAYEVVTDSFTDTYTITNGKRIHSLLQYGKCVQSDTPTPSSPVDIKCNNGALKFVSDDVPAEYIQVEWIGTTGTQYINTGIVSAADKETEMTINFCRTGTVSGNYYGFGASSGLNVLMAQSEPNKWRLNAVQTNVEIVDDEFVTLVLKQTSDGRYYSIKNESGYGTVLQGSNAFTLGAFLSNANYYFNGKFARCTTRENGVVVQDLIPCVRISDGVIGMYDTIGNTFLANAGTGTFTNGNAVGHVDIVGTSEVITVSGKNIFNKDDESQYLNVFVNSNTNAIAQGTTQWCFSIPCKPNTTYTLSGMSGTSRWGSFTSKDIGTVATSAYAGNGTITTGANDKWLVGLAYAQSQTGWIDYRDTLQIEVGSAPTTYEPYREQTAHAENLFAVKNQIDTQDIISGTVTRRCAYKVFNGTEDWREATTAGVFYVDLGLSSSSGYIYDAISTHFTSDPVTNTNMGDMTCKVANSNAFGIAFHVCNKSFKRDLDGFKAWVASLYANGTPIIAVYPTAMSTIESVTAQTLSLTGGSDTLTVTAEVSGINFDIEYTKPAG